jgi:hypothetical protein
MANTVYNIFKKFSLSNTSGQYTHVNLLDDTIKVTLVKSGYVVDPDHKTFNIASSCEFNGTGYVGGFGGSGRKTLASKTFTQDDVNDRNVFDATDVTWLAINAGTAASAILVKEQGAGAGVTDTGVMVICYIDSGFPVTTNGGDLTIQWSTAGIIDLT